jgi:hypothetical protein
MSALAETTTDYREFLAHKLTVAEPVGFAVRQVSSKLFDFQAAVTKWAIKRGRAAIFADCGLGKAERIDQRILSDKGWIPIGDACIGMRVYGSDGRLHYITGVYPQGIREMVRATFSDGSHVVCDWDHLWAVKSQQQIYHNRPGRTITTRQIASEGIEFAGGQKKHFIPLVAPLTFYEDEPLHLIDPYTLGVLLGDGNMIEGTPNVTNPDFQFSGVELPLPDLCRWSDVTPDGRCRKFSIVSGPFSNSENPLTSELRRLGLYGKRAEHKFIPREYLYGSSATRLAILQGILDTDGYTSGSGIEFSTASSTLSDDVVFLVRSLGGTATQSCEPAHYVKDGRRVACLDKHRSGIKLPSHMEPFRLPRKRDKYSPIQRINPLKSIVAIEPAGRDEAVCIRVDVADSLYITEGMTLTHNTPMQLEFAHRIVRREKVPLLIVAPLGVTYQTVEEGAKFGIKVEHIESQPENIKPAIYIINYEKLHKVDADEFGGVVLDESSIIKAVDSKTRQMVIDMFQSTPYKLCCTATPAPNDYMELGNHAEFLGIMTRAEMLAMFFTHDGGDTSKWRLKRHAAVRFWEWVTRWAVMIRWPSDLGFENGKFVLPPIEYHNHVVESDIASVGKLFDTGRQSLNERRAARRGSLGDRVSLCAEIVKATNEQFLIWVDLNMEQDSLAKMLGKDAVSIQGSTPDSERIQLLNRWRNGEVQSMISKPAIFGFGLNFQHCRNVAFVGLSDSWEQFYQATRRVWRFGQEKSVNCHIITSSAEGAVLENIQRKEKEAAKMQDGMLEHMKDVGELTQKAKRDEVEYQTNKAQGNGWEISLGDCVEVLSALVEGMIDYMIFSPPFQALYTYSASARDLGNCQTRSEFFNHFRFLVIQLFRVLRPGRLLSFHCMNLPTSKVRDGHIGLQDFRGDLIRIFEEAGFYYHSEVVIWKDPVTAMQRTKALGLLYKQLCKDSAMSRQGVPDYLVTMRKPGVNDKPVTTGDKVRFNDYIGDDAPARKGDTFTVKPPLDVYPEYQVTEKGHGAYRYAIEVWQRYASPIWFDINPSDTLQYTTAREEADERHIAPLQLQVIERGIELWTNPGDLVLDPFTGIGSTGYVAIKKGRRFIGAELKKSYWQTAVRNLHSAEAEVTQSQMPLFSEPESETEVVETDEPIPF